MKNLLILNSDHKDLRIDKWLKINFPLINQSYIEKNLRKGYIKVNNRKILSKYRLQIKDEVVIYNFSDDIYLKKIVELFQFPLQNEVKDQKSKSYFDFYIVLKISDGSGILPLGFFNSIQAQCPTGVPLDAPQGAFGAHLPLTHHSPPTHPLLTPYSLTTH